MPVVNDKIILILLICCGASVPLIDAQCPVVEEPPSLVEGGCPYDFKNIEGRCVKVLTTQETGADAFSRCADLGANLAIVDSRIYLNKLTSYLLGHFRDSCFSPSRAAVGFWTAGFRKDKSNVFVWKTTRPSKYADDTCTCSNVIGLKNWATNQPDNAYNDENCMEMTLVDGKLKFNDLPCVRSPARNNHEYKVCPVCQIDGE